MLPYFGAVGRRGLDRVLEAWLEGPKAYWFKTPKARIVAPQARLVTPEARLVAPEAETWPLLSGCELSAHFDQLN